MGNFWKAAGLAAAVFATGLTAAAEPTPELKQKFQETIAASKSLIQVKDGKLSGAGADLLRARAKDVHFVMLGEEHGVATIADTVRSLFLDLNVSGYHHFALEADPYMTGKMEAALRDGGLASLAKMLNTDESRFALPFYSWESEAKLAEAVVRAKNSPSPSLWGLDQVFIGAFGYLLRDVSEQAADAEARALAGQLADQAKGDLQFVGKLDLQKLELLKSKLGQDADAQHRQLVDDMILSAKIYAPFVGRPGLSVYAANLEREMLMKRLFQRHYEQAGQPKVFFKFGATHMTRGLSATHVPSLANFVSELALSQGKKTFALLILCGPNSVAGNFMGQTEKCEYNVDTDLPELADHVDKTQLTLIDLSTWKDKPGRWEHLREDVRNLIWAYDAMLFVPNGKPVKVLK